MDIVQIDGSIVCLATSASVHCGIEHLLPADFHIMNEHT